MTTPTDSTITGAPPVAEDGHIIKRGRIKDTAAAITLYSQMWEADKLRSQDRALIQSMLDNFPPISPEKMRMAGKANCSNVNWGDGERVFWEECAPYVGLGFSGRTLFTTPATYGSPQEQVRWATIIAEEATDTVRAWDSFLPNFMLNVIYMKRDGLSFNLFDDPVNWQWKVHPMEYCKIPNHTQIGTANIEYVAMEVRVPPYQIYQKIKDKDIAEANGWNIERTRRALMDAAPDTPPSDDYERWEEYWKNNDYIMGDSTANQCKLIYLWVREVDGTISQYITRNEDAGEDFILKQVSKFHSMDEFLHIYMENLGSNGTYHSIRGIGHKIYSKVQELNRKINSFSDMVTFVSTPAIQTAADVDTDDMETIQWGAFNVFPSSYEFPDIKVPNYEQTIIPALGVFRSMLNGATSRKAQSAISENSAVSRYVLDAAMNDDAQVSGMGEFLFYSAAEKHYREVLRRLFARDYDPVLPGGQAAADFRKRCFARGVPLEAIYTVDFSRVKMNRVIGGGNNNVRALKLQSIGQMADRFDPVGRNYYDHDVVASMLDEQAADRYVPVQDTARLPDDAGIAQVENNQLVQGMEVHPIPGQNDEVHCMIHLQKMGEFAEQVIGQSINLLEVTPPMRQIANHIQEHVPNLPPNSPSTKAIVESLEQFEGMIQNGEKQLLRIQQQQQKEAEQAQMSGEVNGQPQQGPTPEQIAMDTKTTGLQIAQSARAVEQLQALQHKQRMMALDERQRANKIAQQQVLDDMRAAQKIRQMSEQP